MSNEKLPQRQAFHLDLLAATHDHMRGIHARGLDEALPELRSVASNHAPLAPFGRMAISHFALHDAIGVTVQ